MDYGKKYEGRPVIRLIYRALGAQDFLDRRLILGFLLVVSHTEAILYKIITNVAQYKKARSKDKPSIQLPLNNDTVIATQRNTHPYLTAAARFDTPPRPKSDH